ncbi:MAG: tRNA (adenosine(37)-N6)-threonylcarbamoyltransferase complex transferase subunit TsaD [Campylobacter sp.]|nr:tRNA (adenosine(37)-N6)-threonylcarbamoyltransferase complex transferase subunit TsaD [Campylobacter sp.]
MILGIESSCDDSSVALLGLDLELKYHKKISQELEHSKYGGVVPELAARLHTAALPNLIKEIQPYFKDIKAIAVTNQPGLSVSLVGGVSVAKALAIGLNLPLIEVNHLVGHIFSLFLEESEQLPLGVLLVSGGHTMILYVDENGDITTLASTSDDSFGESFDKVAKMMGLGYPGGVAIENLAKQSNSHRYKFTIPLKGDKRLEYSFSGLKNQVRLEISLRQTLGSISQRVFGNIRTGNRYAYALVFRCLIQGRSIPCLSAARIQYPAAVFQAWQRELKQCIPNRHIISGIQKIPPRLNHKPVITVAFVG